VPCRFRIVRDESLQDVFPDLERGGADTGAQPGDDVGVRAAQAHQVDGVFHHACRKTPPARMGRADDAAGAIAEKHRQAIRDQYA
jgi:hypothetical protein